MNKDAGILIVGHNDVIETSLYNYFLKNKFSNVYSSSLIGLETTIQPSVYEFFQKKKPEFVFLASTRSGGIQANLDNSGEFIYHNLESQSNILYAAKKFGTKKLLFYSGSCTYPKECEQPIKEESLLTATLEKSSEAYSVAKIAGMKLCEYFKKQYGFNAIVTIPATVYGPGSDMDLETAHVIGALIGKFAGAKDEGQKKVTVWGTGDPRREFLYVDDFIEASLFLMEKYDGNDFVNMGCGADVSIKELAEMISGIIGFGGDIEFDSSKPDGTMKKLMDNTRISKLGWKAKVNLKEGIEKTYNWYKSSGQCSVASGQK